MPCHQENQMTKEALPKSLLTANQDGLQIVNQEDLPTVPKEVVTDNYSNYKVMESEREPDYGRTGHSPQNQDQSWQDRQNKSNPPQFADSYDFDERNYNDTVEDFDLIPNMASKKETGANRHIEIPKDVNNEPTNRDNDPFRTPGL